MADQDLREQNPQRAEHMAYAEKAMREKVEELKSKGLHDLAESLLSTIDEVAKVEGEQYDQEQEKKRLEDERNKIKEREEALDAELAKIDAKLILEKAALFIADNASDTNSMVLIESREAYHNFDWYGKPMKIDEQKSRLYNLTVEELFRMLGVNSQEKPEELQIPYDLAEKYAKGQIKDSISSYFSNSMVNEGAVRSIEIKRSRTAIDGICVDRIRSHHHGITSTGEMVRLIKINQAQA